MQEANGNIYRTARNTTHLTRIQAAERIGVSESSLGDYETGVRIPHGDVVCKMVEVYKFKPLAYLHLRHTTEVGKYLPDISLTDLPRSVLKLQKEVQDLDRVSGDMVDIAMDGTVDHSERTRWDKVSKELAEMAGAAMAVVFLA